MKKNVTLPLIFSLLAQACGTIPDDPAPTRPAPQNASRAKNADVLKETTQFEEQTVLSSLAALIRLPDRMDPEAAERCLKLENSRPKVAEACLLAWAAMKPPGRSAAGDWLHQTLRQRSGNSRGYALAAARHDSLIEELEFNELHSVLVQLKDDPAWLRADAAARWRRAHPSLFPRELNYLWNLTAFDENTAEPQSVAAVMGLARSLDPGRESEVYSRFCTPGEPALVKVRCLRFLSALVDPRTGRAHDPATLRTWLRPQVSAWPLFEIEFPERALLLSPFRN